MSNLASILETEVREEIAQIKRQSQEKAAEIVNQAKEQAQNLLESRKRALEGEFNAGVVRAKGEQGLNADALRSASGFAGATGVFRFDAQGRVERRFAIYRLTRGKPSLLDAAPAGF